MLRGDAYRAAYLDLTPTRIKIDVEGYEYEVVKGLQETLKSDRLRSVFIEVHFVALTARGLPEAPAGITSLLTENGFKMNYVAAELRGIRKIAAASRRREVTAQTVTRIRQIRLRSKLRGIAPEGSKMG